MIPITRMHLRGTTEHTKTLWSDRKRCVLQTTSRRMLRTFRVPQYGIVEPRVGPGASPSRVLIAEMGCY